MEIKNYNKDHGIFWFEQIPLSDLKIFSANAASIKPSNVSQICWNSSLLSSDDPIFQPLQEGMNWVSIDRESATSWAVSHQIDYQLIANSKPRFAGCQSDCTQRTGCQCEHTQHVGLFLTPSRKFHVLLNLANINCCWKGLFLILDKSKMKFLHVQAVPTMPCSVL